MQNLYSNIRNYFKLPKKSEINSAIFSFSKKEWAVFITFVAVLSISTLLMLSKINKSFMVSVPMHGGSISIGIVGTPRFINPILANSPADLDLVSLVYSGLMRRGPDGALIPDLAGKVETSKDGLTYTFTLKDNIYFHDGEPVQTDDIIFTIEKVKDVVIKSPQKVNWDGVVVSRIDEKNIKFVLKQPYASFLENATLGILPAHVWNNSPIELHDANTNPIGSGPYQMVGVSKQPSGIIDAFELTMFKKFILGAPYIKNMDLHFYQSEEDLIKALKNKEVAHVSSITPANAIVLQDENYQIRSKVLPRIFGLFFNQNQNQLFTEKAIIKAMSDAVDKERIVREVLSGYGVVIDSPIPPGMITGDVATSQIAISHAERLKKVEQDLSKAGWKRGANGFLEKTKTEKGKKVTTVLEFSISTGNAPELAKAAELVKQDLTSIGMKVNVKTFEVGNLNQGVIRPRKYDALLFGQIINHESDLYAFWHSTQRKDPGLNVSMYTNAKVDKILEDASVTVDAKERSKKYAQFEEEVKKDMPAVFLYSPSFIHVVTENLDGLSISRITTPSDRFLNVYLWYTEIENVWKVFAK